MSIENIIKKRHSVRNYDDKEVSNELIDKINKYIENIETPFTNRIRIQVVKGGYSSDSKKLGTYGMIKGVSNFLVTACEGKAGDYEAIGYALEKVILYCTSLGLGTCWLGGTFNKGNFAKAVNCKADEVVPIVSPFGYESDKTTIVGAILKKVNGNRKLFEEVFYHNGFNTPLLKEEAMEYDKVLEMVRIAPSAMNKQPWRIVKENNNFHFYMDGSLAMQRVDMGIAICHFELMAKELGLKGEFKKAKPKIESKKEYIISWIG